MPGPPRPAAPSTVAFWEQGSGLEVEACPAASLEPNALSGPPPAWGQRQGLGGLSGLRQSVLGLRLGVGGRATAAPDPSSCTCPRPPPPPSPQNISQESPRAQSVAQGDQTVPFLPHRHGQQPPNTDIPQGAPILSLHAPAVAWDPNAHAPLNDQARLALGTFREPELVLLAKTTVRRVWKARGASWGPPVDVLVLAQLRVQPWPPWSGPCPQARVHPGRHSKQGQLTRGSTEARAPPQASRAPGTHGPQPSRSRPSARAGLWATSDLPGSH